jgi:hypothetical protein
MKNTFGFKKIKNEIQLISSTKEEFDSFVRNNFDAMEWTSVEIEIFDNSNEWVVCYPDADNILYTQKQFENQDSLSFHIDDTELYFKSENDLNNEELNLIKK